MHGYTQVPPVDVISLSTFAKVVRLIDFANMIYNMKQQHWRSARMWTQDIFEDVTESSEESDVDHSELEQVQSSRSLTQSSDTDSELEEENHPVQGFVIEYMIHEKEEKG